MPRPCRARPGRRDGAARSLARTAGLAAALLCGSLPTAPASAQSNDATLSGLAVTDDDDSAVALSPVFASGTDTYTASVGDIVWRVTVTPTLNDANATAEYRVGTAEFADAGTAGFQVDLDVGDNVIQVKVTAQDANTTQTYQVTVTRAQYVCAAPVLANDERELVSTTIKVGQGTVLEGLAVGFSSDASSPFGELPNPRFTYDGQHDAISDIFYTESDGSLTLSLFEGRGAFHRMKLRICGDAFDVRSADRIVGDFEAVWLTDDPLWSPGITVSVVLSVSLSTDGALSGLELQDRSGIAIALSTPFAFHETGYTASVVNSVSRITITPTARDRGATIRFRDGHGNSLADRDRFTPGRQIDLEVGTNTIEVEVTAEDGVTVQPYTLEVTRAGQSDADATLHALQLSEGVLSPGFASDVTDYTAAVLNAASEITVTAVKTDSAATVEFLDGDRNPLADTDTVMEGHQAELEVGVNTVRVAVTAGNGLSTKTYVLNVTRATQSNTEASLASLTVESRAGRSITLSPAFDRDTLDYTMITWVIGAQDVGRNPTWVVPKAADSAATVEWGRPDAGDEFELTSGEGVEVPMATDTVEFKVTAGDGVTTKTYRVTPVIRQLEQVRCEIPDLTNRVEVWSAVVTVQRHPQGLYYGWRSGVMGHLSDRRFEYRGNRYVFQEVIASAPVNDNELFFQLDEPLPDSDLGGLRMHVCGGDTFELAEALPVNIDPIYRWTSAGLDWRFETTVLLALSEEQFPPVFEDAENSELYTREVTEKSPPGTSIGAPVTATDANGDTLAYSLGGGATGGASTSTGTRGSCGPGRVRTTAWSTALTCSRMTSMWWRRTARGARPKSKWRCMSVSPRSTDRW